MTYFEGDSKAGLEPDLEARSICLAQGVPEDHILPGNAKDNFWGEPDTCIALSLERDVNDSTV